MLVILFMMGAMLGSFFTCIAQAETALLFRRSKCDLCHHPLTFVDLIPIVSYFGLKGKCRYCHAPLKSEHWQIEGWCGFYWLHLYWFDSFQLDHPYGISLIIGWLLWLSIYDYFYLEVPWLGLFVLSLLCLFNSQTFGLAFALWSLLELYIWLRPDAFGGGDAKIIGLLSLTLPSSSLPLFILLAAVLGLIYSFSLFLTRKKWTAIPFIPCIAYSYFLCILFIQS